MSILVIGATGTVGKEVVKRLLEEKLNVTVFVRDEAKAKAVWGNTVHYAVGELEKEDTLKAALKNAEKVFLLTVSSPKQAAQEGHIAKLSKEAGIKHLVKLSVITPDVNAPPQSFLRTHADAENAIIATGVPYTFLRPNGFHSNLFFDIASIKQGAIYRPKGDYRVSYVDTRDIADQAAVILADKTGVHLGRAYFQTGPESLSNTDLAAQLSKGLGREIKLVEISDADYYHACQKHGIPEFYAASLVKLFQAYRTGVAATVQGDQQILTGKEARSLATWLADNKQAFA